MGRSRFVRCDARAVSARGSGRLDASTRCSRRSRLRRQLLKAAAVALLAPLPTPHSFAAARPRVVVVGGGFGGATAAKYVRKWSERRIDVDLVERDPAFVSCPQSNLVLGGNRNLADLTASYDGLERWGVRRIQDEAIAIDAVGRTVKLARGASLPYDRLILSPGVDFIYDGIPSLNTGAAQTRVLHAWKAGPQTLALRAQLEAMRDGGVFVIHIPLAPFRCPPAPYERACLVAGYFSRAKPRSKIIILDANDDVQAEKAVFSGVWAGRYKGYIDYRPNSELVDVDLATLTAKLAFEDVKADVLNVIPPQRAGSIARQLGMANANDRFCQVDFLTYESIARPNIHVLGDSIQVAPLMPKSGHMANQQAKVCAAAVIAQFDGRNAVGAPTFASICYSYVAANEVVHVASVHRYDSAQKTMLVASGSGETTVTPSEQEAINAEAWAKNIRADMLD